MKWVGGLSALVLLVSVVGQARAEEGVSKAIAKGRWSLAFSLPDGGGGEFGVWKMVSGRSNLGVNLDIVHVMQKRTVGPDSMRSEIGFSVWRVSLGPSIKRYLVVREKVSPFLLASLQGLYGRESDHTNTRGWTLKAGLGADWTPLESISIGASTGFAWTESMTRYAAPGAPKDSESFFDTMTTSLTLHLYF